MCENCFKVERTMKACVRCRHAWYCSQACRKAQWRVHRRWCEHVAKVQKHTAQRDANIAQLPEKKLVLTSNVLAKLDPDKPLLLFFWLRALLAGFNCPDLRVVERHCLVLIAFLWYYTFAAVPLALHHAVLSAVLSVGRKMYENPGHPRFAHLGPIFIALRMLLMTDPGLQAAEQTEDVRSLTQAVDEPHLEHFMTRNVLESLGTTYLMDSDSMQIGPSELHEGTAMIGINFTLRGGRLLGSMFGLHHRHDTVAALLALHEKRPHPCVHAACARYWQLRVLPYYQGVRAHPRGANVARPLKPGYVCIPDADEHALHAWERQCNIPQKAFVDRLRDVLRAHGGTAAPIVVGHTFSPAEVTLGARSFEDRDTALRNFPEVMRGIGGILLPIKDVLCHAGNAAMTPVMKQLPDLTV